MSKAIKVEEQVYKDLDKIRGKGETFSMVVEQLLKTRAYILNLIGALEGSVRYDQWKREQLEDTIAARAREHLGAEETAKNKGVS